LILAGFNVNSPSAIAYAAAFLDGPAAAWWTTHQASIPPEQKYYGGFPSFSDFAQQLEFGVGILNKQERAREDMDRLYQRTSVLLYGEEFTRITADLPDRHASDLRYCYLRGLKHDIREMLTGKIESMQDWTEIHKLAHACDELRMTRHRYSSNSTRHTYNHSETTPMELGNVTTHSHHHLSASSHRANTPDRSRSTTRRSSSPYPRPSTATPHLVALTDQERDRLRQQNACFRCRKPGHVSRDCPLNQQRTSSSRSGPAASQSASPRPKSKN
jgi:hypothetical protein